MTSHLQTVLRSVLFAVFVICSALVFTTALRLQVSNSLVGLSALVYLAVTILYATSWYLRSLWVLSGRLVQALARRISDGIHTAVVPEQSR